MTAEKILNEAALRLSIHREEAGRKRPYQRRCPTPNPKRLDRIITRARGKATHRRKIITEERAKVNNLHKVSPFWREKLHLLWWPLQAHLCTDLASL